MVDRRCPPYHFLLLLPWWSVWRLILLYRQHLLHFPPLRPRRASATTPTTSWLRTSPPWSALPSTTAGEAMVVAVVITTKEVDLSLAAVVVQTDETTLATALRAEICVGSEVVVAVAVAAKVAAVSRPTRIAILRYLRRLKTEFARHNLTFTRDWRGDHCAHIDTLTHSHHVIAHRHSSQSLLYINLLLILSSLFFLFLFFIFLPLYLSQFSLIRILECHQTTAAATITRLPSRRRWFQLVVMVLPVVVLAAVVKAPTPPSPMAPVVAVVMEVVAVEW